MATQKTEAAHRADARGRLAILDWEFRTRSARPAYAALMKLRSGDCPRDRNRPSGHVQIAGRRIYFRRLYLKD